MEKNNYVQIQLFSVKLSTIIVKIIVMEKVTVMKEHANVHQVSVVKLVKMALQQEEVIQEIQTVAIQVVIMVVIPLVIMVVTTEETPLVIMVEILEVTEVVQVMMNSTVKHVLMPMIKVEVVTDGQVKDTAQKLIKLT